MRIWDDAIPADDREIYELSGFGNSVGFGKKPAMLIIDVQYRTAGDRPAPIREAITEMYPTACGQVAWDAVEVIERLLKVAHAEGVPVLYPHVAPKASIDAGRFGQINPGITNISNKGYDFVESIAPVEGDVVIPKRHASAFFGTALMSYLVDFGVDTLIVTGATTSGCVRATVADAFSYNLHTIVVEDAVFDRLQIRHKISLLDMDAKYADVLPSETVLAQLLSVEGANREIFRNEETLVEFLTNAETTLPSDMTEEMRAELISDETKPAKEPIVDGYIKRLWRVPGRWENWTLWEAADATDLHQALISLPLWPWMDVSVYPLARHYVDPETSKGVSDEAWS